MAYALYKNREFEINGEKGTLNQLKSRFSFINQIDRFNNELAIKNNAFDHKLSNMLIKSSLKRLSDFHPNLIETKFDGTFKFKISFLQRTKILRYFFNFPLDGADAMQKFYNFTVILIIMSFYTMRKILIVRNTVIFVLDNELDIKDKPLKKFVNSFDIKNDKAKLKLFKSNLNTNIIPNLYLTTHQLVKELSFCEIEYLFEEDVLKVKINNKTFNRHIKKDKYYIKSIFVNYISRNYKTINFDQSKPMLNNINDLIT